jgi:Glycosyl hydrolases family 16
MLLSKWGTVVGGSCTTNQVGTPPNCYPAPPTKLASGKQWKMLFNDEFDDTTLNLANFTPCFGWNYGGCTSTFNNGREHYDPAQVQLSNGTAKLVAEPLIPAAGAVCYGGACTYRAGLISTARPRADNGSAYLHPFTYGYVESRMKYLAVSGFFTAFWMLPTDYTYTYRSEIDIVEILGDDPDTIFMAYHYNDRSQNHAVNNGDHNNGACQVKDYSTDFVTFGMDWQADHVAWYINGVKCGQFKGNTTTIENGPMQIILHMMVDNNWQRSWGLTLANLGLKAQLEVNYLRVYQQQ